MKKILVLGATGFIGKALVNNLKNDNYILAYGKEKPDCLLDSDNVKYIIGDLENENRLNDLVQDIDIVIHLACSAIPSDDTSLIEKEIKENVIPTIRMLEILKEQPKTRLIFASSAGTVYGESGDTVNTIYSPTEPNCSYGVQKIVIEDYINQN